MALGYDKKLYILAFDHRGSFEKMFGVSGRAPTRRGGGADLGRQVADLRGLPAGRRARARPRDAAGVLVDAQYGPQVARAAQAERGYLLAMPVEKSGQNEFDFEYGERFGEKIEEFDPDFSKVLVRYNPEGDARDERAPGGAAEAPVRLAARARPQVPLRAARACGAGTSSRRVGGRRGPLRHASPARS